jgi:hypothetical protein
MVDDYDSSKNAGSPGDECLRTVDEVIEMLAHFTPEQRSLAWCPAPPFQSAGASDCRTGGNCGLDFNHETARGRWVQARHRWNREQRKLQGGQGTP